MRNSDRPTLKIDDLVIPKLMIFKRSFITWEEGHLGEEVNSQSNHTRMFASYRVMFGTKTLEIRCTSYGNTLGLGSNCAITPRNVWVWIETIIQLFCSENTWVSNNGVTYSGWN